MKVQGAVASEELGFDVTDPKQQSPEHDEKFLKWIIANGSYFKSVLDKNTDVWGRIMSGSVEPGDIHWIKEQLRDDIDTGIEPTDEEMERAA
jgi:hypothetical protein